MTDPTTTTPTASPRRGEPLDPRWGLPAPGACCDVLTTQGRFVLGTRYWPARPRLPAGFYVECQYRHYYVPLAKVFRYRTLQHSNNPDTLCSPLPCC